MFQRCITGEDNTNEILFHDPIGSAKKKDVIYFHPNASAIKYVQHDKNTCCFSTLKSVMYDTIDHVSE